MRYGIWSISELAQWVTHFPIAQVSIPHAPPWTMLLYGFSLCFLCLVQTLWRFAALLGVAIIALAPFLIARPDILVSSDAALIGVRRERTLFMTQPGFMQKWTAQKWAEDFSLEPRGLKELLRGHDVRCEGGICLLTVSGQSIFLNLGTSHDPSKAALSEFCARSIIKVNVAPARSSCREIDQIDRFRAWKEGAFAIYLNGSRPLIVTDRSWRGSRIWAGSVTGQGVPNLPLAAED